MRKTKVLVTTMALMVSMSITAFAGEWKQDAIGWWYQNDDGSYPINGWQTIDGKDYYFDENGYMLTDTVTPDGFSVDSSGAKIPVQTGDGTRENPFNAFVATDFSYTLKYVPEANFSARLQLLEKIDGGEANRIVDYENMFNETPSGDNRWVLYHFQLTCLSSNKDYISGNIVNPYYFFNENSTVGLSDLETATLGKDKKDRYSVKIYPEGTDDFWVGVLLDNSIPYITYSIDTGSSSKIWFTTK